MKQPSTKAAQAGLNYWIEGALWLAKQTPNILCYLPSSDSYGIYDGKYYNRYRNKFLKDYIFVLYYLIVLV